MLRNTWFLLSLMITLSVYAQNCFSAPPEVDIYSTPESITITQTGKAVVVINSDNSVSIEGKKQKLSATTQHQAAQLRQLIVTTLPWVYQSVHQQLDESYLALDNIVSDKLGKQSQLHQPLAQLDAQLKQQLEQIISQDGDSWSYRYSALKNMSSHSEKLINDTLAALIQSSMQHLGSAENSESNSLLSMLNSVIELQNSMQQAIKSQKKHLQALAETVNQRATAVESARLQLYHSLDL